MRTKASFIALGMAGLLVGLGSAQATAGGSGQGTAVITPSNVVQGSVVMTTVTFTVPSMGMATGGKVVITLPPGWGPSSLQTTYPAQSGYFTLSSTSGVFTVIPSTSQPSVKLVLSAGSLSSGATIQAFFNNVYSNCPSNSSQVIWGIKSAMTSADPLTDLVAAPAPQTLVLGPFQ